MMSLILDKGWGLGCCSPPWACELSLRPLSPCPPIEALHYRWDSWELQGKMVTCRRSHGILRSHLQIPVPSTGLCREQTLTQQPGRLSCSRKWAVWATWEGDAGGFIAALEQQEP